MIAYTRRATPLHAARAGAGAAYACALALAVLLIDNPVLLGAIALGTVGAAVGAGVARPLLRLVPTILIVSIPIVVVQVLVSRQGLTVFARLGNLGPFGQGDLTVEALVYGVVIALKVAVLMLATALASMTVDPDELLRVYRRLAFRPALTASLATRMVPVLLDDARRLAEAQRTRPPAPGVARGSRMQRMRDAGRLVHASVAGALDRSLDVAAILELRGFEGARSAPRRSRPRSRHDLSFMTAALLLSGLAIADRIANLAPFATYPLVHLPARAWTVALAAALPALMLAPFLDRRGVAA
ncbi:MAG TPA: energy-coupling factor transporter transmembrane component T [Solirubrobacteraceae bacterium]|jgi:energy-coupling factor transport system permease protein|nr:energy-coupling factor transporter transmembrane component T [Solirubrobacteraceae bacterium]